MRADQISLCMALVTGPGGPKQQKGYPWSLTKGEVLEIDFDYLDKKKITVIPSAMDCAEGVFKSDGSRVAYLVANATVKAGQKRGQVVETLRQKLLTPSTTAKSGPSPGRTTRATAWRCGEISACITRRQSCWGVKGWGRKGKRGRGKRVKTGGIWQCLKRLNPSKTCLFGRRA